MAGITISLGWAIVLWVISGIFILIAIIVGLKSYLWPFLRTIRIVRQKEKAMIISEDKRQIPKWLENMAEQDLSNLSQRIKVEINQLSFAGVTQNNPEFEIFVSIVNCSVFKVRLESAIGYIQFAGSKWEPKFEPTTLLHSERKLIILRQTINEKTAELFVKESEVRNTQNFVCGQYRLVFKVLDECYKDCVPAEIPLREGGLPCVPYGNVLVANNLVATFKG